MYGNSQNQSGAETAGVLGLVSIIPHLTTDIFSSLFSSLFECLNNHVVLSCYTNLTVYSTLTAKRFGPLLTQIRQKTSHPRHLPPPTSIFRHKSHKATKPPKHNPVNLARNYKDCVFCYAFAYDDFSDQVLRLTLRAWLSCIIACHCFRCASALRTHWSLGGPQSSGWEARRVTRGSE